MRLTKAQSKKNAAKGTCGKEFLCFVLVPVEGQQVLGLIFGQVIHPIVDLTLRSTGIKSEGHGGRGGADDHLGKARTTCQTLPQPSKTQRLSLQVPACASELSDERILAKVEIVSMPDTQTNQTQAAKATDTAPSLVDRGMSNTRTAIDPRALTRRRASFSMPRSSMPRSL